MENKLLERYEKAIPECCSLNCKEHQSSGFCNAVLNQIYYLQRIDCSDCEFNKENQVSL